MNQAKIESKVRRIASKLVNKVIAPQLAKMSLPEQVKVAKRALRATGLINFRSNLLQDDGLPDDFRDLAKKGMTQADIKLYYWTFPEFVSFWTKDLQMTEYMLDQLIESSLKGV
jgi:hypothetical protein